MVAADSRPSMKASILSKPENPATPGRNAGLRARSSGLATVDQVMVEERATSFTKRSIKTGTKLAGLKMVISMMDLTSLEGKDTPGRVAYLCSKALQPGEAKYGTPAC